ncbi:hypothetical protein [Sinorhizobium meliloti]|uniref:hypothetical protein n=1 Tax=Rhizobium meliloti TaxID=382 RepID=UPI0001E4A631|nr:hypothetical protein [Sinorhizobium meliloti]AEG53113.1 hypothetical protein Sinme_1366 [Sinorhizobium meliloti AK83]MDE4591173.1 hypothetical protein [Sinorhizobium meliloti]SEI55467.1 hypothetical protein SAMN04244575_01014 [Sinorhizobium meliloti]
MTTFTEPFRLRVMKALTSCLQEITIANGYNFDLATSVFRGRMIFGENDPIPMVSILEPPLPLDRLGRPLNSSVTNGPWDILIQGFVKDDREHPTDPAHMLMADVKKRLAVESKRKQTLPAHGFNPFGMNERGMKNRVEQFTIGPGVVRPPEEAVSTKAYFWLTLSLQIVEDNFDPFG